jgi:hypothetical protein
MKLKTVIENQGVDGILYYAETKRLSEVLVGSLPKSGALKNEGKSHDVDENKGK